MPRNPSQERDELRIELAARIAATDQLFEELQVVVATLECGLREAFLRFGEATKKETQERWEHNRRKKC